MPMVGQLDKRVLIQSPEQEKDAQNQPVDTWVTMGTRWARIDPIAGRERFVAAQEIASVTNRITMRSDTFTRSITPEHRIVHRERIFTINSARDVRERQHWRQFVCTEVIS